MKIKFEAVCERDIDLLVMNNIVNGYLLELFLNKIDKHGYKIESIEHSYVDDDGENDITVILGNDKEKFGLLIEDKIDAPAMPDQAERYGIRGDNMKEENIIDDYEIFIIAPQKYLDSNLEAKKYPNNISYEEIRDFVTDDYSKALLEQALSEAKHGYCVVKDENTTAFWEKLYDYILKEHAQDYAKKRLDIKINRGVKGPSSIWPIFRAGNTDMTIIYKSDRCVVDLGFARAAKHSDELSKAFAERGVKKTDIVKTGKSLSIRKLVDNVDFKKDFDSQKDKIEIALQAVMELNDLAKNNDLHAVYKEYVK